MKQLQIGNVTLDNNVILAPMAGVTDLPFRLLCKEQGAGLLCMEMVSAKAIYYNNKNTDVLLEIDERELPVSLQLFGSDPVIVSEMAKRIEDRPFSLLDINMGCPVPKVVNNGEGSALMKDVKLAATIVNSTVKAIKKPVTVKFRLGFDDEHINCVEFAKAMEEAGASAIALHARTREQYYSGQARWEYIQAVKNAVKIPVIGNGDIFSGEDAVRMFKETGCDGIMIGRGAQGNPWIFGDVISYLETGSLRSRPDIKEICETMRKHGKLMLDYKGEFTGIREMRKHVAWYLQGQKHAAKLRKEACSLESFDEFERFLQRIQTEAE